MAGLGGEVLKDFGVNVALYSESEVLSSLLGGVLDGTEWMGPHTDLTLGLHEGAKNYYSPGWQAPGSILDGFFNRKAWAGLSDEHIAIIEAGAMQMNLRILSEFQTANNIALNTLISQHGVTLRHYSSELLKAFSERASTVIPEIASRSSAATRLYNHIVAFRRDMAPWTSVSEEASLTTRPMVNFPTI